MTTGIVGAWVVRAGLVLSVLSPVQSLDWQVQHRIQESRSPGLEPVMRGATEFTDRDVLLVLMLGVAVLTGPRGPATVREVLIALIPTNVAVESLKWVTNRTRPDGSTDRRNSSFPSSHAANAFAVAWVLGRRWGRAAPVLFAVAALVAISRMYLNRHFMSDVLFGAMLGSALAYLAGRVILRSSRNAKRSEVTPAV